MCAFHTGHVVEIFPKNFLEIPRGIWWVCRFVCVSKVAAWLANFVTGWVPGLAVVRDSLGLGIIRALQLTVAVLLALDPAIRNLSVIYGTLEWRREQIYIVAFSPRVPWYISHAISLMLITLQIWSAAVGCMIGGFLSLAQVSFFFLCRCRSAS